MDQLSISNKLLNNLWNSLDIAIAKGDCNSIQEFIMLFRRIISDSIEYKKIEYFRSVINFPSKIYYRIYVNNFRNSSPQFEINEITKYLSLHLSEIINSLEYLNKPDTGECINELVDKFYYEGYQSFSNLFYQYTRSQNWELLATSLIRYSNLNEEFLFDDIENIDINDLVLSHKRNRDNVWRYKRQIKSVLKYWLYYLFDKDCIDDNSLNQLVKLIQPNASELNREIEDLLYFRTTLKLPMNWDIWDYKDRQINGINYIPMPSEWITKGFIIDRIRNNNSLFDVDGISSIMLDSIPFLYNSVKKEIKSIKDNFEKWEPILKDRESLVSRGEELLKSIGRAKKVSSVGERVRTIVNSPLDSELIDRFKEKIGTAWKSQARIRRIFSYFQNTEDVTNSDVKLKLVGRNIFMERAKMMFVQGEYHEEISGVDILGGNIGRNEDDLFFDTLFESKKQFLDGKTMLESLINCITDLDSKGVKPTVILVESVHFYLDGSVLNSGKYSPKLPASLISFGEATIALGTFEDIPIFGLYSPYLKNRIIVADFSSAFLMYYKSAPEWFENSLYVDVNEVTPENAYHRYKADPNKWNKIEEGVELSEEDSKLLIRSSVFLNLGTIIDFKIIDDKKFKIGAVVDVMIN